MSLANIEQYEWMVYLFDGITLVFVGLFLLSGLIGNENNERTLPILVASLACLVMSIYFFSEAFYTKNKIEFSLDFSVLRHR